MQNAKKALCLKLGLGILLLFNILRLSAFAQFFPSVSNAQVILLGRRAHAQLVRLYGLWNDPAQQARVDKIGHNLLPYAHRHDVNYRFFILDSNNINAMATPDGSIHIFRGLLEAFPDDHELTFIIGHEMTHVEKRHGKQQIEKALRTRAMGNTLLGFFGGGSLFNQLGVRAGVGGATYWLTMKYSRDFEFQADEGGVLFLQNLGIDPHDGAKALAHLQALDKSKPGLMKTYFGTHPLTPDRIAKAQEIADHLPPLPKETPSAPQNTPAPQ